MAYKWLNKDIREFLVVGTKVHLEQIGLGRISEEGSLTPVESTEWSFRVGTIPLLVLIDVWVKL